MLRFTYFIILIVFLTSSCKEDSAVLVDENGQPCERDQPIDPNDFYYNYDRLAGEYGESSYGCICELIENPNTIYESSMIINNDAISFGGGQSYAYELDNGIIRFNGESFYLQMSLEASSTEVVSLETMDLRCNYLYLKD